MPERFSERSASNWLAVASLRARLTSIIFSASRSWLRRLSCCSGMFNSKHQFPHVHAVARLDRRDAESEIGIAVAIGQIAVLFRRANPRVVGEETWIPAAQALLQRDIVEPGDRGNRPQTFRIGQGDWAGRASSPLRRERA
jgi:hypothetical protein